MNSPALPLHHRSPVVFLPRELAEARMETWAAYLRGQADALGIRVIDTSDISIEGVADALQVEIDALRSATGAAA